MSRVALRHKMTKKNAKMQKFEKARSITIAGRPAICFEHVFTFNVAGRAAKSKCKAMKNHLSQEHNFICIIIHLGGPTQLLVCNV